MTELGQATPTTEDDVNAGFYPLTAMQQMLLLDPYINHRSVSCCAVFSGDVGEHDVRAAIDFLLQEQPALTVEMRTSAVNDGQGGHWVQRPRVIGANDILVEPGPIRKHHDRCARVRDQLDVLRAQNLDPRTALGIHGVVVPDEDGLLLVLIMHHLVADALSRPLIVNTLEQGLGTGRSSVPSPGADTFRRYALDEVASRTRRPVESSRTAALLRQRLEEAQPGNLALRPVDRDQRAEMVVKQVEGKAYNAFHRARAILAVTTYTALLSALFLELAERGATPRPTVMTKRTRRLGREARRIVGTFADLLILVAPSDLTATASIDDLAPEVGTDLMRALATKEYFIDLVTALAPASDYVSGSAGPVITLQYIDVAPKPTQTPARVRLWYRSETETNFDRMGLEDLHIICSDHGESLEIAAWCLPGRFVDGEVEELLEAVVDRLLALPVQSKPLAPATSVTNL